jgi:hypothetical protein
MATVKKIKKAQDGLRTGQYKRLGRIAEKNPERAEKVAGRMTRKADRIERGKDIASPRGNLMMKMNNAAEKRDRLMMDMRKEKNGGKNKKFESGGSLSGLNASNKRVGPVDPKGAYTKVQKKTLAGAKGKAVLKKDKQLGATKMKNGGPMKKCKYGCK